jgi:alpha-galactosidase
MSGRFTWGNGALTLTFGYGAESAVCLERVVAGDLDVRLGGQLPLAEIMAAGRGHWIANDRLIHTTIGRELRYVRHRTGADGTLDRLVVTLADRAATLAVDVVYEMPRDVAMVRTFVTVTNTSAEQVSLESVTSWVSPLGAPASRDADLSAWTLLEGDFDWLGEGRWHATAMGDLFPVLSHHLPATDPRGEHAVVSTGTWSTGKHAPLGLAVSQSLGLAWVFQVEHNGAWRWEVGQYADDGYVALSGPTSVDHSWSTTLEPGQSFRSVPASVAPARGFDEAVEVLTAYRRAMRSDHEDNTAPKVVFNDYMNTIGGDPTTARLLPLVAAAAEVGAQVFCIDAGWYDDTGDWWPSVGDWEPSATRFPGGLGEVIDAIKAAGMVPGLWIEPEVVGVRSPVATRLPDSAFFQRHGRRIVEQERYVLDLRDQAARDHLDAVIDRLVDEYGIGYFKFDYNVSPGAGTEVDADSPGDGLLGHNRAYSAWVDALHARFPHVILENCSSGGMREDFAQTSRFQVQSTSDQQDYRLYPAIAAAAPLMMLPEQAASWAYPQATMSAEECAFALSTTFLGRFFLSGYVNRMDDDQRKLIAHAVMAYRDHVQPIVGQSVPFWPVGLPGWRDRVVAVGLRTDDRSLVTVWARAVEGDGADEVVELRLPHLAGRPAQVRQIFPDGYGLDTWDATWDAARGVVVVAVPPGVFAARTFLVAPEGGESRPRPDHP